MLVGSLALAFESPGSASGALEGGRAGAEIAGDGERPGYVLHGYRWTDYTTISVYYNWEMEQCPLWIATGSPANPPTPPVPDATARTALSASIEDLNDALEGRLRLVLAGEVERTEFCEFSEVGVIYMGYENLGGPAVAGFTSAFSPRDRRNEINSAGILINSNSSYECSGEPRYRELQLTMTHELLHALGVDHSNKAQSVTQAGLCSPDYQLQPDDTAALHELYPLDPAVGSTSPSPPTSPNGRIGLGVTSSVADPTAIAASLAGESCAVAALGVLIDGRWLLFITGAPAAVNALFPPTLAELTPYFYRCL